MTIESPESHTNIENKQNIPKEEITQAKKTFAQEVIFGTLGTIFCYPFYRTYLQYKVTTFTKDFNKDMLKNVKSSILEKGNNSLYRGANSYIIYRLWAPTIMTILPDMSSFNFIFSNFLQTFAYPLILNSNLKALSLPGVASMKNLYEINLLFKLSNYKGYLYFLVSSLTMYMPFINYVSHQFETIRLAYVLGPYYGHDFKNYKEARTYLKVNKLFSHGRFYYNIFLHIYNITVFGFLLSMLDQRASMYDSQTDTKV